MIPLIYTLVVTHLTMIASCLYIHRSVGHRSVTFHPALVHFFRFWMWLTDGLNTREWTAQHRRHHVATDKPGDPHSPVIFGIKKIAWEGFFTSCYQRYGSRPWNDAEELEFYGKGCPDDWLERNVYVPHLRQGLVLMLIINVLLFGRLGILIWIVQLIWTPLWSNSVITGLAHWKVGYHNPKADDNSRNIPGIGFFLIGDEYHSNHHANPSSPKLSQKWYEFDLGWFYIKVLRTLRLARIRSLDGHYQ
jgi:stearoyl-CoA desaturase (delta-9 desaturase)